MSEKQTTADSLSDYERYTAMLSAGFVPTARGWRTHVTPRKQVRLSKKESAILEQLARRGGLTYQQMARVASRLFGRHIWPSTVQQHLKFKALRQERELEAA